MTDEQPLVDVVIDRLRDHVAEMKITATLFVRRHAAFYAPDVSPERVDSICAALGEISLDEATAALNRLQGEANP